MCYLPGCLTFENLENLITLIIRRLFAWNFDALGEIAQNIYGNRIARVP